MNMAMQLSKYGKFSVPYEMTARQNPSTNHNKSINKSRPAGCSVAEWTLFATMKHIKHANKLHMTIAMYNDRITARDSSSIDSPNPKWESRHKCHENSESNYDKKYLSVQEVTLSDDLRGKLILLFPLGTLSLI
jgi:hypothetical protein